MSKAAREYNITKINIDTDLRLVMTGTIRQHLTENPQNFDPRKYLGAAREAFTEMVRHKVRVCGSSGQS
jgi:fructose-bisphosphate aldolase class II